MCHDQSLILKSIDSIPGVLSQNATLTKITCLELLPRSIAGNLVPFGRFR